MLISNNNNTNTQKRKLYYLFSDFFHCLPIFTEDKRILNYVSEERYP